MYEGKIQVGDLGAADGAAVTIKVIDQQETNAITVPIAAVKQNGSGQDVVRVIDIDAQAARSPRSRCRPASPKARTSRSRRD